MAINPVANPSAPATICICAIVSGRRLRLDRVAAGAGAGAGVGAALMILLRGSATRTSTTIRWPASQRAGAPLMK